MSCVRERERVPALFGLTSTTYLHLPKTRPSLSPAVPNAGYARSIFKGRPEVPTPLAQDPVADWVELGDDRALEREARSEANEMRGSQAVYNPMGPSSGEMDGNGNTLEEPILIHFEGPIRGVLDQLEVVNLADLLSLLTGLSRLEGAVGGTRRNKNCEVPTFGSVSSLRSHVSTWFRIDLTPHLNPHLNLQKPPLDLGGPSRHLCEVMDLLMVCSFQ